MPEPLPDRWWELARLKQICGAACTPLGHDYGPDKEKPDYAYLAADVSVEGKSARKYLVQLRDGALITFEPPASVGGGQPAKADSFELSGARSGEWLLLFHVENTMARSAISFFVEGDELRRFLVAGLAPGVWQIWRNGWLLEPMGMVEKTSGALYLETKAGSFFLRRQE